MPITAENQLVTGANISQLWAKAKQTFATSPTGGNFINALTITVAEGEDVNATITGSTATVDMTSVFTAYLTTAAFNTTIADYAKTADVTTAITEAIAGVTQFEYQVVGTGELPETGKKGVIYLKSNSGSGDNAYDEYIWVVNGESGAYEKIGTTAVDLSGYLKSADAETTYLSKTDAASTYLTKTDATSTYLTKTDAASTYATIAALDDYLKSADAEATYATKAALTAVETKADNGVKGVVLQVYNGDTAGTPETIVTGTGDNKTATIPVLSEAELAALLV